MAKLNYNEMVKIKIDPYFSIAEQLENEGIIPKSVEDEKNLYDEIYDNLTDSLWVDECGQIFARGLYIAKCKM